MYDWFFELFELVVVVWCVGDFVVDDIDMGLFILVGYCDIVVLFFDGVDVVFCGMVFEGDGFWFVLVVVFVDLVDWIV